jgi:hypothetical protein
MLADGPVHQLPHVFLAHGNRLRSSLAIAR